MKAIREIIGYVVQEYSSEFSYLCLTHLSDLLFLIDEKFFQIKNETMTGFNWILGDYGPLAFELRSHLEKNPYLLKKIEETPFGIERTVYIPKSKKSLFQLTELQQECICKVLKETERKSPSQIREVVRETKIISHGIRNKPICFSISK